MSNRLTSEQSRNRQKTILTTVFVAIMAILAVVLYLMPWSSKDVDIGFSDEARRNPYLAAEQFLSQFDVPVKTENGLALLDKLPSTEDTLLIASSRRSLSERRVNDLTNWVHDGGALIVLASDLYAEDREDKGDRLLNNFGVWLYEGDATDEDATDVGDSEPTSDELSDAAITEPESTPEKEEEEDEAEPAGSFADAILAVEETGENCVGGAGLTSVSIDGQEQDLAAELSSQRHLYFDDTHEYAYAANDIGAQLVYIEHGLGRLYVLTSLNQWRNRHIGCFDHAHMLRTLTENTNTLWLMFNTDIEPLHQLVWNKRLIAVCFAFAWLLFWVWRSAYRSTRIEPEEPKERREIMEHIAGMSRFLYQQKELGLLLSGLRTDCFNADPTAPNQKERLAGEISRWSEQLGIDEAQIHWALTATIGRDGNDLTNAVALLQKIRNHSRSQ